MKCVSYTRFLQPTGVRTVHITRCKMSVFFTPNLSLPGIEVVSHDDDSLNYSKFGSRQTYVSDTRNRETI